MASVIAYTERSGHIGQSAVQGLAQPSSHMSFGTQNIWDSRQLEISTLWDLFNSSSSVLLVDLRIELKKRRGLFPDETWVDYRPGEGRIIDRFQTQTGIASIISPPFALPIPPGQSTPQLSLFLPGPAANNSARNFWNDEDNTAFNFVIELFQMPFNGATRSEGVQIGSHEFKDVFEVDIDPPPLSALDIGNGGAQPRLILRGF